jgi:hypothetical protein
VAVFDEEAVEEGWDEVWSPEPLEVVGVVVAVDSSEPLHSRL